MNIYEIKESLKRNSNIFDLKLRVVYYARVSTDKYDQINSLSNQINYYEKMIRENSNWTFVDGYIDEGISGTSTKKRDSFNQMINDAYHNKFDLIITKEISRFARDTLDSIKYTRKLLEYNVGVFFQNDNLNTFDSDSELKLTIMSSIAQEEVRKLSERVKFGFQRSIESGHVLGNDNIWGYIKNNGKLLIVEDEAKIVKLIFELYVNDNIGMRSIGRKLMVLGYFNKNQRPFSQSTIKSILTNPKYKGYYCGNKSRVIDYHTKKKIGIKKEEWALYKDNNIPAIIDEYTWNKAQEIINKKSSNLKHDKRLHQNRYPLSGKIFCVEHNVFYRRKVMISSGIKRKKYVTWRCANFLLYGNKICNSPSLHEDCLKTIISKIVLDKINKSKIIEELMEEYQRKADSEKSSEVLKKKEFELIKCNTYKNKLYDLLKDNIIDINEFKIKIKEISDQIDILKKDIEKTEFLPKDSNLKLKDVIKFGLDNIKEDEIIRNFLEKINVYKTDNKDKYKLNIVLSIGIEHDVYFNNEKHHLCTTHTYD